MKWTRWAILLIVCYLIIFPSASLAWAPEGWFDTEADLPSEIRNEIPSDEAFQNCFYNGDTAYLCTEADGGAQRMQIFRETNGNWVLIARSVLFPEESGHEFYFGSTCNDKFYLFSGEECFLFTEKADGEWRLFYVQSNQDFYWLSDGISWEDEYGNHALYGDLPSFSLSEMDPAKLPRTLSDARTLLHVEDWAVVSNPKPQDRLHLRTKPSQAAPSLGKYYSGTPVHILQTSGDWAKVDIYGIQGYMMLCYLARGAAMETVQSAFPHRAITEQAATHGVIIYALPDLSSQVTGLVGKEVPHVSFNGFHILGVVGEDWYHISVENDQSGYVQVKDFWDGNG